MIREARDALDAAGEVGGAGGAGGAYGGGGGTSTELDDSGVEPLGSAEDGAAAALPDDTAVAICMACCTANAENPSACELACYSVHPSCVKERKVIIKVPKGPSKD